MGKGKRTTAKQTEREDPRVIAASMEKERERLDRVLVTVIRASLDDADMTHKELADRLGLTPKQVANMLSQRKAIHASMLIQIAQALKLTTQILLDRVQNW